MTNITHTLRKLKNRRISDDVAANQLEEETEPSIPRGFFMLLASTEQVDQTVKKGKDKSLARLGVSPKFGSIIL